MNTITSESGNVPFTGNIAQITEYTSSNLFSPAPLPITITKNSNGTITITFPSTGWSFVVNLQSNQLISQNLSGANVTVESSAIVTIDFRLLSQDIYRLIISPVSASVTVTRDKNISVSNNDSGDFISVKRSIQPINTNQTITIEDIRFSPPPYPITINYEIIQKFFNSGIIYKITITINNTSIAYEVDSFIDNDGIFEGFFLLLSYSLNGTKITANHESFIFQFPYKNGILGDRYEGKLRFEGQTPILDITVFRSKRAGISS
jgi:hypothetical protein